MPRRFRLDTSELADMAHDFAMGIDLGLAQEGQEIKALVTFVRATPEQAKEALVLDLGGTRVRAARLRVGPEVEVLAGPVTADLPIERGVPLSRVSYLAVQSELLGQVSSGEELPLGYCFSYPARSLDDGDAILLRWTKEVFVPDTEGERVGAMLVNACRASGIAAGPVTVVNDTVAALLAGLPGPAVDGYSGLIVGTGTNLALLMPAERIRKLPRDFTWPTSLPVNLESGNYTPPCLNAIDDAVDLASGTPGTQRFEKAVSGVYLGRLLAAAAPDSGFDGEYGSAGVVDVAAAGGDLAKLAQAILDRSADLVAAALAGATLAHPESARTLRVVAEGGLFWGAPGYCDRVNATLATLLPAVGREATTVDIVAREQANLIGAAMAT